MRKLPFLLAFALITIVPGVKVKACSCVSFPPDFFTSLQMALGTQDLNKTIIVKGKLISTVGGYGVRMHVLQKYLGGSIPDTPTIWGDPGITCRFSPTSQYQIPEDTIIAIIHPLDYIVPSSLETANDFYINGCGFFHVLVRGDSVYGGNSSSFTFSGYPFSAFLDSIYKITGPLDLTMWETPEVITLYPNPAKNKLFISGLTQTDVEIVSIHDFLGRHIYSVYRKNCTSHIVELPLNGLVSGHYYCRVYSVNGRSHIFRFSKN